MSDAAKVITLAGTLPHTAIDRRNRALVIDQNGTAALGNIFNAKCLFIPNTSSKVIHHHSDTRESIIWLRGCRNGLYAEQVKREKQ